MSCPHCSSLLSRRETEAIDLRAQGYTVAEISEVMGTTPTTVKTQLASVHRKLGAKTATGAVWEAMRRGIIEPPEKEVHSGR